MSIHSRRTFLVYDGVAGTDTFWRIDSMERDGNAVIATLFEGGTGNPTANLFFNYDGIVDFGQAPEQFATATGGGTQIKMVTVETGGPGVFTKAHPPFMKVSCTGTGTFKVWVTGNVTMTQVG